MTDQELLALLQENNPLGYETLIEDYADLVFRAAYRIVQNEQDAEDMMQETFVTVYKKIGDFRGDAKLSSWLYRIASNAALDLVRAKKRKSDKDIVLTNLNDNEDAEPLDLPDENATLPEDALLQEESLENVKDALADMSPKLREAYLLYMLEGYAMKEIAEMLEIKLSAAKVRVYRARQFLNEYFR